MFDIAAVLVLCDQVYQDRGKLSVLGGMWSTAQPGERPVRLVAFLNVKRPTQPTDVHLVCKLIDVEGDGEQARTEIKAEIAPPETDEWAPPFQPSAIPVEWVVDLRPESTYLIEMQHDGAVIATTPFFTAPVESSPDASQRGKRHDV